MTIQIKDLTVSQEIDMSAVRGGLCVDVGQALKEGFEDSGFAGLIAAAGACLDLINNGVPACTN